MIQKIDLLQNALHHKKVALLDGIDPQNDGFYVVKMLLEDFNNKLSEVIDHINAQEGHGFSEELANKKKEVQVIQGLLSPESRSEASTEVLRRFVNPGESCITLSAGNALVHSQELTGYDVVLIKRVDEETAEYARIADRAIELAGKRAIVGVHKSLLDKWNFYMARVPYHWEQYEMDGDPNQMDYFIIDKLEGQETLAETP